MIWHNRKRDLAYVLLMAVNMNKKNEKLAIYICNILDYQNLKDTIAKIFGDPFWCM